MKKFLQILGKAAPVLAGALTGGAGPAAIAAKAVLGSVLGTKPDASSQELDAAVQAATPEQLVALRNADNDYRVSMEKLSVQRESRRLDDVADARELKEKTGTKTPDILAFAALGLYAVVVLCGIFKDILGEPGFQAVLHGILSVVMGGVGYFLGASRADRSKDRQIERMAYRKAP